jgi:hypothetical protein
VAISPATPEYLKWSKVPITFDCSDHPDFVPMPGRYPPIVSPIVKYVKLNRILIDGGSSMNILFLKTFDQMGLSRSLLHPSRAPFHGIVPSAAATPIGQIALPVTFGTQKNFHTETIQFEVIDFKTVYNASLGRLTLSKFMEIPHYAYLILKMPRSCGIISIRGDVKLAPKVEASLGRVPPPQTQSCLRPRLPRCPSSRRTHSVRQSHCPWRNLPR